MQPVQHQIDYEIPLESDSWVERIERACRVLEERFPGERLYVEVRREQPSIELSNRRAYLRKKLRTKYRWFAIDNGKYVVGNGRTGWRDQGYITVGGRVSAAAEGLFRLHTIFREAPWNVCEAILVALGDALEAYSAPLSPPETMVGLRRVQWRHGPPQEIPNIDLPRLHNSWYGGLQHPAQPHILGWLNYWSRATCEYLGFPDPDRDQEILSRSYRTPGGAWLVKLSEDPLSLSRDDHVALLETAYARFDRLGVRC